jgi:4-hydroxy-tetrahydrodipicolinate synthase
VVVRAVGGRVPVIAGVSAGTPAAAIALAADAADVGASALMMLPPLGYRADADEIVAYYRSLVRAYREAGGGRLVDELDRIVRAIEREMGY